jgi:hypothetical protein
VLLRYSGLLVALKRYQGDAKQDQCGPDQPSQAQRITVYHVSQYGTSNEVCGAVASHANSGRRGRIQSSSETGQHQSIAQQAKTKQNSTRENRNKDVRSRRSRPAGRYGSEECLNERRRRRGHLHEAGRAGSPEACASCSQHSWRRGGTPEEMQR